MRRLAHASNWRLSRLFLFSAVGLVYLFGSAGSWGVSSSTESLPDFGAIAREDSRFDSPISIWHSQTTVGELLLELSRQSGIDIAPGQRDGSADVPISVFCRERKTIAIIEALCSLLSANRAEWTLSRVKESHPSRYVFEQPLRARQFPANLRKETDQRFSVDVAKMLRSLDSPDDEKARTQREVYGDHEVGFHKYNAFTEERMWADLRVFKEAMTQDERQALLNGDLSVTVPMSQLSPHTREFYSRAHAEFQGTLSNTGLRLKPPESARMELTRKRGLPQVRVLVANSTSAMPTIGGVKRIVDFWERMRGLWMLPGDASTDAAEDKRIPPPGEEFLKNEKVVPPFPEGVPDRPRMQMPTERIIAALTRRMEQIADCAKVAIVARLPQNQRLISLSDPTGMTLKEYWQKHRNAELMIKWRRGVLLMSTITWPLEDSPIPSELMQRLRMSAKPGEVLPFDQLTAAAVTLTVEQLLRLQFEFPTMKRVAESQWLFVFLDRFPALARQAAGRRRLALTPAVLQTVGPIFPFRFKQLIGRGEPLFLSLFVQRNHTETYPRQVSGSIVGSDGSILASTDFSDVPQPKLEINGP